MNDNSKTILFVILLGSFFLVFRFLFGLSMFSSHDELQIYLIGLKSYLTETYPYYGPDIVYTNSQIPGGLQGLLISWPLQWLGIPEAPYILLNILSFFALLFFGWYLSKRITNIPQWFIYIWLLTSPWTLHYSTHIENPSYALLGSILFFVSIFELSGFYKSKIISSHVSFLMLGFSIFWIMQLHLSWVLTLPYFLWVCWRNKRDKKLFLKGMVYFVIGASISISTLLPTLIKGFGSGTIENNIVFNHKNILEIPNIILRFLMFASYELARFIGHDTASRLDFLAKYVWLIPIAIFLLLAGFFQAGYFIFSFFRKNDLMEWSQVKQFTIASLLLVSFSFLFSVTGPRSHTFYILYPVAIWYSFYCYGNLFKRKIQSIVMIFLAAGILFHVSLFIYHFEDRSLFAKRELVTKAISEKDYTLLAVRRESNVMLTNRKPIWKTLNSFIRYADFEVENPYFKSQNIVNNIKYDGKFSCKVDSIQPFSISYSEKLENLGNPKKVKVSFWAITTNIEDFILVYEVGGDEENNWNSKNIESANSQNKEWEFIELELDLPSYKPTESKLVLYFWMNNKSGAILNIDNWKLEFE